MKTMERLEDKSMAEKRRELRKSLEKDTASHDKFGMNDVILIGIVLIAMVISLTDFTLSFGDLKNFTALTLFLYVITTIVYRNRYNKGKLRGRSDPEYIDALQTYRTNKNKITELGMLSAVPTFCQEYKARELKEYRKGLLMDVDLDYDEYMEKYRHLPKSHVMRLSLPLNTRKTIIQCNEAMPLKLTAGLILNESGEADRQNLVGQSGREREIKDKRKDFIQRGLMVVLGGMIAVDVILDFSFITVIQWFVRMLPILSAIIMGNDSGFCDIAVTETNFKKDQTSIIHLFFEHNKIKSIEDPPKEEPLIEATEDTTIE
jgi:hypothetical protein